MTRSFEHAGRRLNHHLEGPTNRPVVVLTHGSLLDHRSWRHQVEALRTDFRTLVWDLPGHGGSDPIPGYTNAAAADALVALMDHLRLERAILVGHSVGGYVAQEVAYRHPERVQGLACIGTTPITLSRMPRPVTWLFAHSAAMLRPIPFGWLRGLMALVMSRRREVRAYVRAASAEVDKESFLGFWTGVSRGLRYEPDHRFGQPLLIARGAHDLIGAVRVLSKRWKAHCPEASYAIIPDAGHCAHQDNPAFTNRLLRTFLDEVTGPKTRPQAVEPSDGPARP